MGGHSLAPFAHDVGAGRDDGDDERCDRTAHQDGNAAGTFTGLGIDETTGAAVVAIYGASVYLLSVIGGFAADRVIGARRSTLSRTRSTPARARSALR